MSKQKKAKKDRRPNIAPLATVTPAPAQNGPTQSGGAEMPAERKPAAAATVFNYTYVKKDLTRIGILAGSFIAILVILSFFLNR